MREIKYEEGTYSIDKKKWFKAWNHPYNPFANWHEPMPYPEKRVRQAPSNPYLAWLWWQFWRNPIHNFSHFVLGITPIGKRYEWITPDEDGWIRDEGCWIKGKKRRCMHYMKLGRIWIVLGWRQRGNFTISIERGTH